MQSIWQAQHWHSTWNIVPVENYWTSSRIDYQADWSLRAKLCESETPCEDHSQDEPHYLLTVPDQAAELPLTASSCMATGNLGRSTPFAEQSEIIGSLVQLVIYWFSWQWNESLCSCTQLVLKRSDRWVWQNPIYLINEIDLSCALSSFLDHVLFVKEWSWLVMTMSKNLLQSQVEDFKNELLIFLSLRRP